MEALLKRFADINKDVSVEMRKAINQGAREVRTTAIESIERPSYGRVYARKVEWRKVTKRQKAAGRVRGNARKQGIHIASKAGQPPNKDTGNLVRNIRASTGRGNLLKGYYATVEAETPYAMDLEKGTSQMKPRPFMKPALQANKEKINNLVRKAIRSAIK